MFPTIYIAGNHMVQEAVIDINALTQAAYPDALISEVIAKGVAFTPLYSNSRIEIRWNPTSPTYMGWSPWGEEAYTGPESGSICRVSMVLNDAYPIVRFGARGPLGDDLVFNSFAEAMAGFQAEEPYVYTGYAKYRFYIDDEPVGDNIGGLSLLVREFI